VNGYLQPIDSCKEINSLNCKNTGLSFDEQLQFYGVHRRLVGLAFCGDSINNYDTKIFAIALCETPPSPKGFEDILTALTNDSLISCLKGEQNALLAGRLLRAFFALSIEATPDAIREELAGNAIAAVTAGLCDAQTEKLVFERLVDKGITNSSLAFKLACYAAKRGDRGKLLEYISLSLKKGHDPERFRIDAEFAAYRDDPGFMKLLDTPAMPDPETDL
jgi:hypothetical protein